MALETRAIVNYLTEIFRKRPGLWVGIISFALFGTVAYFLVTALLTPDQPGGFGQPQIQMHQIVGQGQRGNKLGWRFVADSSDISTDGQMTTYHHVRQAAYYLNGKPAYELTADQVSLDLRSQNYTATGKVHVWSVRPHDLSDLRSDYVVWNNPLQMLSCPGEVHVKYKGFDMVTSRLEANLLNGTSSLGATSIRGTQ